MSKKAIKTGDENEKHTNKKHKTKKRNTVKGIVFVFVIAAALFVFFIYTTQDSSLIQTLNKYIPLKPNTTVAVVEEQPISTIEDQLYKISHNIIVNYFLNKNAFLPVQEAEEYATYVIKHAQYYKLDPFIIAAIIGKESTVNFMARSKVAHGLMQIHWNVHKDNILKSFGSRVKTLRDIYYPSTNILIGCWIFADCMKKSNNKLPDALSRYYGAKSNEYINAILSDYSEMASSFYKKASNIIKQTS